MRLPLVTRTYVLIITFVALPLSTLADSAPSAVAFTSSAQTIAVGVISDALSVQVQDGNGEQVKVPSTACASMTSSSVTGEFSSNVSNWNPVSVLTISRNSANRNFYYRDTTQGTPTLSVHVVIRPDTETRACASWPIEEWPGGWVTSQMITVGDISPADTPGEDTPVPSPVSSSSTPAPKAPPAASSGGSADAGWVQPQIYAYATAPSNIVAGADVKFSARAIGLKKEPIIRARYVWSFGDGGSMEGQEVYHSYHYPGTYVVIVEASSGEWSAMDRKDVTVRAPMISISQIREGADGFIELTNNGKTDIDLARWFLGVGDTFFMFPTGTILPAGKAIPFPSAITLLQATPHSSLLYPNGKVAVRYTPEVSGGEAEVHARSASVLQAIDVPGSPVSKTVSSGTIKQVQEIQEKDEPTDEVYTDTVEPLIAGVTESTSGHGVSLWLLSALALSFVTAGSYLLVSRGTTVPPAQARELSADDFKIEEDTT